MTIKSARMMRPEKQSRLVFGKQAQTIGIGHYD